MDFIYDFIQKNTENCNPNKESEKQVPPALPGRNPVLIIFPHFRQILH